MAISPAPTDVASTPPHSTGALRAVFHPSPSNASAWESCGRRRSLSDFPLACPYGTGARHTFERQGMSLMQPRVESPRNHRRSPLAVWAAAAGVAGTLLTVAPRTAEAALANITEWAIPTPGSGPHYITTGPDGPCGSRSIRPAKSERSPRAVLSMSTLSAPSVLAESRRARTEISGWRNPAPRRLARSRRTAPWSGDGACPAFRRELPSGQTTISGPS